MYVVKKEDQNQKIYTLSGKWQLTAFCSLFTNHKIKIKQSGDIFELHNHSLTVYKVYIHNFNNLHIIYFFRYPLNWLNVIVHTCLKQHCFLIKQTKLKELNTGMKLIYILILDNMSIKDIQIISNTITAKN